jgi:hypothetical protein
MDPLLDSSHPAGGSMKVQVTKRELFALLVVTLMSVVANLPANFASGLIDRRLLLSALVAVVVIAMFRYLQLLLLLIISILAFGVNLPKQIAQDLGISQAALLAALVVLVAITLLNRRLKLLPTHSEPLESPDPDERPNKPDLTNPRQAMFTAIAKGDIATVRTLLAMKAEINFTLSGTTPLHMATEKGYSNIVQLLIEHGADLLAKNAQGQTPLEVALAMKKFARTTDILFSASKPHLAGSAEAENISM